MPFPTTLTLEITHRPSINNGEVKWLGFVGGDLRNRWFSAHGSHGSHRSSDFLGMCGSEEGFRRRIRGRRGLPGKSRPLMRDEELGDFWCSMSFFVFLWFFLVWGFLMCPFFGGGSSYDRCNMGIIPTTKKKMICLKKRLNPHWHDGWVVLMKELWVISQFQEN